MREENVCRIVVTVTWPPSCNFIACALLCCYSAVTENCNFIAGQQGSSRPAGTLERAVPPAQPSVGPVRDSQQGYCPIIVLSWTVHISLTLAAMCSVNNVVFNKRPKMGGKEEGAEEGEASQLANIGFA